MKNNLAYLITGNNPEVLKKHSPYSRKKIQMLAYLVLLPTIFWFLNGFLITHELMGKSSAISVLAGCVCAFIIFIIDRAIILSNGGKIIFLFRVLLGIAVAFVGALLVDSILFKDDVDRYLLEKYNVQSEQKKTEKEEEYDPKIFQQEAIVKQSFDIWQMRANDYKCEMDGTCGSKIPGHAKIAASKLKLKDESKAEYDNQCTILKDLIREQKENSEQAKEQHLSLIGNKSLLHRIENMHEMILSSKDSIIAYAMFFFIALCIELMVIIIKLFTKKSSYEKGEEIAERMFEMKLREIEHNAMLISDNNNRFGIHERDAKAAVGGMSKHALLN
jgi:hypothetical protein